MDHTKPMANSDASAHTVWDSSNKSILFTAPAGFSGQGSLWFTDTPPDGWLICDGSILNIEDYPRLFILFSNNFGGDGVTTFALPDLRQRVPVGQSAGDSDFGSVGLSGGQKSVSLDPYEIPPLPVRGTSGSYNGDYVAFGTGGSFGGWGVSSATNNQGKGRMYANASPTNNPDRPASYHNNLQPFLTVNYIIKI